MNQLRKLLNVGEKSNLDNLLKVLSEKTDSTDIEIIENSWNIQGFLADDEEQSCECGGKHTNFILMKNIKTHEYIVLGKSCYEQIWNHDLKFIFDTVHQLDKETFFEESLSRKMILFLKYADKLNENSYGLLMGISEKLSLFHTSSEPQQFYRYNVMRQVKDYLCECNISKLLIDELMNKLSNSTILKEKKAYVTEKGLYKK